MDSNKAMIKSIIDDYNNLIFSAGRLADSKINDKTYKFYMNVKKLNGSLKKAAKSIGVDVTMI